MSDYDEALGDLLDSPEFDTFEDSFFGEVASEHHEAFVAMLREADAVHGNSLIRAQKMAAAAEWLIKQAEDRRVAEAHAALTAMLADDATDAAIARAQNNEYRLMA